MIEYIADGKIASVGSYGSLFTFYRRPVNRPDLKGMRVKARKESIVFSTFSEAEQGLAIYADIRGWKKVRNKIEFNYGARAV